MRKIPDILYHYCSSDSFYGIITSKEIWLSNSIYSNDPNENKISQDILTQISLGKKNKQVCDFAKQVLNFEFKLIDNVASYVLCLSTRKEDLNQWRIYGDYGYGFTLGFRPKYFIDNNYWTPLKHYGELPKMDKIYIAECIYDNNIQKQLIISLIKEIINLSTKSQEDKVFLTKQYLQFYSSIFKHKSYADEHEWRLICFPIIQSQEKTLKIKFPTSYKTSRGLITQYIKQNIYE